MAIRRFAVGPVRGLKHAAAEDLPNLVVICGPNGSGKSTLLHQPWERRGEFAEGGTEVTYLGPHRPWRKTTLALPHLYEMPYEFHNYLTMGSIPGFRQVVPPGLQFVVNQPRIPESVDEAFYWLDSRKTYQADGPLAASPVRPRSADGRRRSAPRRDRSGSDGDLLGLIDSSRSENAEEQPPGAGCILIDPAAG